MAFFPLQDQKSDNLTWQEVNEEGNIVQVVWPGGKIPQDRTIVRNRLLMVNLWLYLSMVLVAVIGVFLAMSMVYFNFRYGHRRIIQNCKLDIATYSIQKSSAKLIFVFFLQLILLVTISC